MNALTQWMPLWLLLATSPAGPTDADVLRGIARITEGDFQAAVFALDEAILRLGADPARRRELALAYLYQGVAYLELEQEGLARGKFHEALERDADLALDEKQFSSQQIRVFESVKQARAEAARVAKDPKATKGSSLKLPLLLGGGAAAAGAAVLAAGGAGSPPPAATPTATPTPATASASCVPAIPAWVAPADRAVVSRVVTLSCRAPADLNCAGAYMNFRQCFSDCSGDREINIGDAFNPPTYSVQWDTTSVPNGSGTVICILFIPGQGGNGVRRTLEVRN